LHCQQTPVPYRAKRPTNVASVQWRRELATARCAAGRSLQRITSSDTGTKNNKNCVLFVTLCSDKNVENQWRYDEIIAKVLHFPLIFIAHITGFSNCFFKVL
jgi:hypothetical protein